jgi:magnesium transporter
MIQWIANPETELWRLGFVVGIAMTLALTVGTLVGSSLPLVVRRCGADPATASTIFLTMVTDAMSFLVFLGLASALSQWLGLGG